MKSFEAISQAFFHKGNKSFFLDELEGVEREVYKGLSEIKYKLDKEAITKEEATSEKIKLKTKYDLCLMHDCILSDISKLITTGIWNTADTVEFATFIATGLTELCDKASKHKDLSLYNEFIVQICNYLEGKMKEVSE